MPLEEHADYLFEKQRLEDTIDFVEKAIEETEEKTKFLKQDTREAFKELDDLDSNLSYNRIALNSILSDLTSEKNYGLLKARTKPYFCRIDVKLEKDREVKNLYIGKIALAGEDVDRPLIVDWRTPVASVYYDGRLGDVNYISPAGEQHAKLFLKRQYTINDGTLENILDVDITTNDTFLQAALGENKDNRLQDIVSTIQAEQNAIIRTDIYSPVVVQGAAGSGKTTIALHRIAYLIYTFEKTFRPDEFLIIAPNRLFLNYISEVLPELGVERVRQSTFIDIAYELLGIRYKLANPDEKLVRFISHRHSAEGVDLELLRRASELKGLLEFKAMLDGYIAFFEANFIPEIDFSLSGHVILTVGKIRELFLKEFSRFPIYQRAEQLKKVLSNKLKRKSNTLIAKTEEYYDSKIEQLRVNSEPSAERKEKIIALIDARNEKVELLKLETKAAMPSYFSLLPKLKLLDHFYEVMTNPDCVMMFYPERLEREFISYFCEYNREHLSKKTLEYEDLTALLYLKHKIFGFEEPMEIKYIVIDEAQDFSLFQIAALKELFHTELFTILGDTSQGIHSYRGIKDWNAMIEKIFPGGNCKYLTLEQSYRTTIEIMDAANELLKMSDIPNLIYAKPVVRHGVKPGIYKFMQKDKMIAAVGEKVAQLKGEQYKTIALICKTAKECTGMKKQLEKRISFPLKQLSSDDVSYEGGMIIVPSYLAKGLEFDAVIICTFEEDYLTEELDLKLLYVGMTRALHRLDFIHLDNKMELLDRIPREFFGEIYPWN